MFLSALILWFFTFWHFIIVWSHWHFIFNELTEIINSGDYNKFLLSFSLVFLVSAIAFKIGVIPFHMWLPDVYEGSSYTSLTLISSIPKIAGFALIYRILDAGFFKVINTMTTNNFFNISYIICRFW